MSALRLEGRERGGELKISAIIKKGHKNESKGLVWGQNRENKGFLWWSMGLGSYFCQKNREK